ncbi:hypothetical protein [Actinacidiphila rubida]|uniref:Uncharacterized protein n=1 Tax=Actinacidiphila rubida TaxID=310780 RepID=A0A1H8EY24_9ACTN|nr:hypothetical protein [Actinacidiphila rubida]SEN24296.1 hypothetical protein SAMN05216267_100329 [Actinacidiphila rubida]
MDVDRAVEAAASAEGARRLLDRAREEGRVELKPLYGLELCTLGGHRHALGDESIGTAWSRFPRRSRSRAAEFATEGLVSRGLLTEQPPALPGTVELSGRTYALDPRLALPLWARGRPHYAVVTEVEGRALRTPRLFAPATPGDAARPLVVEIPEPLPAEHADDFPHARKLGPLGWLYRYLLVTPQVAATLLADLSMRPPPPPDPSSGGSAAPLPARVLSVFHHPDGKRPSATARVRVTSDGVSAHLLRGSPRDDAALPAYDKPALEAVIADLLARAAV